MEELTTVLKMFAAFEKRELEYVNSFFYPRLVKKNEVLLTQGSVAKEFYFVRSGGIRTYFLDEAGHQKTRYIMLDNHIGTALASFIGLKPSLETIEALEASSLLVIDRADFYQLANEMENWRIFYLHILEKAYTFQNARIENLVNLTAQQRFDRIVRESPHLTQRVPNKVLASYLDIREETLSRLKSK